MEQLANKKVALEISSTLIKVDGVPEELKEKVESLVMGYVAGYEAVKHSNGKEAN